MTATGASGTNTEVAIEITRTVKETEALDAMTSATEHGVRRGEVMIGIAMGILVEPKIGGERIGIEMGNTIEDMMMMMTGHDPATYHTRITCHKRTKALQHQHQPQSPSPRKRRSTRNPPLHPPPNP